MLPQSPNAKVPLLTHLAFSYVPRSSPSSFSTVLQQALACHAMSIYV